MPRALDQLHQDHRNASALLDLLDAQLAAFGRGERPDYELIESALDYFLTYPDLHHHPLEDLVYRALARRDPGSAQGAGNIIGEHERLRELTRRLNATVHAILGEAEVARDAVDGQVREFMATYRKHMAYEDERFFPAAAKALTDEDWSRIDATLEDRDDPLFGPARSEQFIELRREIEAAHGAAG